MPPLSLVWSSRCFRATSSPNPTRARWVYLAAGDAFKVRERGVGVRAGFEPHVCHGRSSRRQARLTICCSPHPTQNIEPWRRDTACCSVLHVRRGMSRFTTRPSHHADRRWIAAIADGLLMEAPLHGALQPHAAPRAARPRNERASRPNAEPPHPLLSLPRWDRAHRVAGPPVATTIANGALAPAADVSAS